MVPSHTCNVPAFDPEAWHPGPQPRVGGLGGCRVQSSMFDRHQSPVQMGRRRKGDEAPLPPLLQGLGPQARAVPHSFMSGSSGPKSEPRVSPGGHVWSLHPLGEGVEGWQTAQWPNVNGRAERPRSLETGSQGLEARTQSRNSEPGIQIQNLNLNSQVPRTGGPRI